MANVLSEEKRQQVIALGRLGWSLRRVEAGAGVRRETASAYLKEAGIEVRAPGRWGRTAKPANEGNEVTTDSGPPEPRPKSHCAPFHQLIEDALLRVATSWASTQLVDEHGFSHSYEAVKRYVSALRGARSPDTTRSSRPPRERKLRPNFRIARGTRRCFHDVCGGDIPQGSGLPNRNKVAGVVSVGGALHERFAESVFANPGQLSKALVRGRLGPSREAQPSDLVRGQISAHRQHCQELLIAVLKPIATERLAELRRLTLGHRFTCVRQSHLSAALELPHRHSRFAAPLCFRLLQFPPPIVPDHCICSYPRFSTIRAGPETPCTPGCSVSRPPSPGGWERVVGKRAASAVGPAVGTRPGPEARGGTGFGASSSCR